MKSSWTDIKTLYKFEQDVHVYADKLIYGVILQIDVGDRLAESFFKYIATFFWKKIKDTDFESDGHSWDGALNYECFSVS